VSSVARPRAAARRRGGSARYLRSHRRLLWRVSKTELQSRFAGSVLGLSWAFIGPFLILGIYAAVYLEIFQVKVENLSSNEYVVYIFAGLTPYLMTAEAIAIGVQSVIANRSVLNNTVFPIDLAPVKSVVEAQATMAVGMLVVVVGAILTDNVHSTLWALPIVWVLHFAWLLGLNWLLSLLNVVFRDIQTIVTYLLMIMFVMSPIAFTPDMVPDTLRPLLAINPFAYFVVAYQQVIMLGIWPSVEHTIGLVVMSVGTFALGSWFFARAKDVIIDYV
jgi:lipopolysaccharide transport system permease protein